jgi:hypothetical protein
MAQYEISRLGSKGFEELVQALLKTYISVDTTTFGAGKDGAREATYTGQAVCYPNKDPWAGHWIFQAKFHDPLLVSTEAARKIVLSELKDELGKIVSKYQIPCDFYILATNVPFTGTFRSGMLDKVKNEIAPNFSTIREIRVWHYDDICRMLDNNADIRIANFHLITPGDVFYEIFMNARSGGVFQKEIARKISVYVGKRLSKESIIGLDQLGRKEEGEIRLRTHNQ